MKMKILITTLAVLFTISVKALSAPDDYELKSEDIMPGMATVKDYERAVRKHRVEKGLPLGWDEF